MNCEELNELHNKGDMMRDFCENGIGKSQSKLVN